LILHLQALYAQLSPSPPPLLLPRLQLVLRRLGPTLWGRPRTARTARAESQGLVLLEGGAADEPPASDEQGLAKAPWAALGADWGAGGGAQGAGGSGGGEAGRVPAPEELVEALMTAMDGVTEDATGKVWEVQEAPGGTSRAVHACVKGQRTCMLACQQARV
jgi:hypothetical protein